MVSQIFNEQKITEVENQLLVAMRTSNVDILDQLLHDDLLFILASGDAITKQMDLQTHKSGSLVLEEISSSIDSIKLIGDNAVVTLISKLKGSVLQQNFEGQFRYIRVWKLFDNELKVIAGSCVAI